MDGVIVDFTQGLFTQHNIPSNLYDLRPNLRGRFLKGEDFEMSEKDFWKGMEHVFWTGLQWTTDGKQILQTLESAVGQSNVCLLSSPPPIPSDPETKHLIAQSITGKMDWIEKHLPAYFYERRFLFGACKEFCTNPNHVLVDDADHNIQTFSKAGGQSFLIPRLWNTLHPYIGKHNTLKDLHDYLHNRKGSQTL